MEASKPIPTPVAGFVALITSGVPAMAMVLYDLLWLVGKRASNAAANLSNFIFDFGAVFILLAVLSSIVGLVRGGRSRKLCKVAIGIIGLTVLLLFAPALSLLWKQ